ncbi:MAG: glycosyltransferase family 39 protein [Chloroflexota bacterium]
MPRLTSRALPALLLAGFFVLGLAFSVINPLWEALDEPEHFQYVKFLAERHTLPSGGELLPSLVDRPPNELFQPPLYYALEAPFVAGIDLTRNVSWVRNPYFTWPDHPNRNAVAVHTLTEAWPYHGMVLGAHIMRAVSVMMGTLTLALIWLTARRLLGVRLGLFAALLAGLTPVFLLSSASIDNDNAAALTSALALALLVRVLYTEQRLAGWFVAVGASLGLALLAKTNTAVLLPLPVVAALILALRERAVKRPGCAWRCVARLAGCAAGVAAVAGWYFVRPSAADGFLAHYAANVPMALHELTPGYAWGVWQEVFQTYWGSFGWEIVRLPDAFYLPLKAVAALALLGLLLMLARRPRLNASKLITSPRAGALLLLALALAGSLAAVVLWHGVQLDDGATAHARFILPALTSCAVFLALGLASLPRGLNRVASACASGLAAVTVGAGLLAVAHSFGATAAVYGDAASAGVQHPQAVVFEHVMELVGWNRAGPAQVPAGGTLRLRLFWASSYTVPSYPLVLRDAPPNALRTLRILPPPDVLTRPDFDYSAFVRLADSAGQVIHDRDHGPGQGVGLLPHLWQPGEVIPDDWVIRIPGAAKPGTYALQLGVYDYRNGASIPTLAGQQVTVLGSERVIPAN